MPKRGEVYDFDFGPQSDSRMEGPHPAVVVQTDLLNQVEGYSLTIVVPLSTKGRKSASHVSIAPSHENGLDAQSFAKCEQIYTVPTLLLRKRRGQLSKADLYQVGEALKIVLSLG